MPFKSEKQRRYLWLKHPDIAKRWAHEYPNSNKNLPMYADKDKEKDAALSVLNNLLIKNSVTLTTPTKQRHSVINDDGTVKNSADGLVRVDMPKKHGPSYAGEEREEGNQTEQKPALAPNSEKPLDLSNPVAAKLATVLAQPIREQLEAARAAQEGRDPLPVPRNMGIKRYAIAPQLHQLPMGMQQPAPAQSAQPAQQPANTGPVGGGSNPQFNPIKAFGPLGASGQLNGNAAFGVKNSPDSSKTAAVNNKPCSCGCGDTVSTCKCPASCTCRKPGGSCYKAEKSASSPAWQRSAGKNPEGGLNEKGRKSYERETGGDLKAPVTESNPSGERAKRQNSFCSRMCGMKRVNTGSETKNDPDSRINKSLRKWNCKCSSAYEFGRLVKQTGPFGPPIKAVLAAGRAGMRKLPSALDTPLAEALKSPKAPGAGSGITLSSALAALQSALAKHAPGASRFMGMNPEAIVRADRLKSYAQIPPSRFGVLPPLLK